jgi:hypothetical protein
MQTFRFIPRLFQILFAAAAVALAPGFCLAQVWDSARYMHVSEVRRGMSGYGLTVFSGTKIEKFDVTVVDVLKNLVNPKCDVVLISCHNPYMEHVGPVEGMSGSPIFLYDLDDAQHEHPRMIGAFAYGWEWSKDPLAGVQPIEYMLKIPVGEGAADGNMSAPDSHPAANQTRGQISRALWSLADVPSLPGMTRNAAGFKARSLLGESDAYDENLQSLRPLATPLMTSGFSTAASRRTAAMFAHSGLDLMATGGSGASAFADENVKMEPGSALVAPLLTGDIEMNALGTCTEVRGDQVYGFGHEFNNEGPIRLPMGTGTIATIVADLHSSFKLGALAGIVGTLTNDRTVGIGGIVGPKPPMVPVTIRVRYEDGSVDQTYHCQAVLHPKFTPLVAAAALQAALAAVKDLPEYHTLDYNLTVDFQDGKSVHIVNRDVNEDPTEMAQQLALPIMAASDNPFEKVPAKDITGTIDVSGQAHLATITAIMLPKLKYEPGATVDAYIVYRPWRSGEQTMPISFDVPKDLPDGQYQLIVSDWERYFTDQRLAEPFRFTAETIDDLFSVVNDFESIRHNALYVRLVRQADGVAVGRTAMPLLPASVRDALLGAGHSDMSPFVSSIVHTVPTELVMNGAAEFTLTVDRNAHVETGRAPKPAATQP